MGVLTETFVQRHKVIYTGMRNKQIVYNNPLNTKGIHTVSDLRGYLGRQGDKENRLEKC